MRILALDFETSGLDVKRHAPVTLGVSVMEDGEPVSSNEWLFAPPVYKDKISREYDVNALVISGVSWSRIKSEGLPHAKVLAELGQWVKELDAARLPVVAFNASFDLAWYSELLFMAGSWNQHTRSFQGAKPPILGPWHCARMLAIEALQLDSYSLDSVSAHFGMAREKDTHGALEDAILAGKVFHRLLNMGVTA